MQTLHRTPVSGENLSEKQSFSRANYYNLGATKMKYGINARTSTMVRIYWMVARSALVPDVSRDNVYCRFISGRSIRDYKNVAGDGVIQVANSYCSRSEGEI